MKKYQSMLLVLAAIGLMGCAGKSEKKNELTKIAPYLWEVTVPDHADTIPVQLVEAVGSIFQCSAVRNGNYYGRNLDFLISEASEIVIHVPAKGNRHASIGVGRFNNATDEDLAKGLTDEQLSNLVWGTCDGINDAGLFCNVNVVNYADGGDNPGTNPGKPDLYNGFLVRALLDNCATVEEAMDYVNNHNLYGRELAGFNFHFMIGDPNRTVVLEFVDNKAVFVTDEEQASIMTNFFVSMLPEIHTHADGVERYAILKEHYAEGGESAEGMYRLLERVRYSQAYDTATEPFWLSEYEYKGKSAYFSPKEEVLADSLIQTAIARFAHYRETGEYQPEWGLWYTEHVSIYDIEKKEVIVTVHEDYTPTGRYTFRL